MGFGTRWQAKFAKKNETKVPRAGSRPDMFVGELLHPNPDYGNGCGARLKS
jgi:hypothetical protein